MNVEYKLYAFTGINSFECRVRGKQNPGFTKEAGMTHSGVLKPTHR